MTQEETAEYNHPEGYRAMSMPEHFTLFDALYELRNKGGDVEEARQFPKFPSF
jgi:hypothetical protein